MDCEIHFRNSHRRSSIKKIFLKLSQNSQENTCFGVSILIKLQTEILLKKRIQNRCCPVNFAKFLGTSFFRRPLGDCFCHLKSVFSPPFSVDMSQDNQNLNKFNSFMTEVSIIWKPVH